MDFDYATLKSSFYFSNWKIIIYNVASYGIVGLDKDPCIELFSQQLHEVCVMKTKPKWICNNLDSVSGF